MKASNNSSTTVERKSKAVHFNNGKVPALVVSHDYKFWD